MLPRLHLLLGLEGQQPAYKTNMAGGLFTIGGSGIHHPRGVLIPLWLCIRHGYAASNSYWVSLSVHATRKSTHPSGIVTPGGQWAVQCTEDRVPSIAVVDINDNLGDLARPWRRKAKTGIYEPHQVDFDPRSDSRNMF